VRCPKITKKNYQAAINVAPQWSLPVERLERLLKKQADKSANK